MTNLIIIGGAPGSGKTVVSKLLSKKLNSPFIDFGDVRNFHLDPKWKKANKKEEKMSFKNLIFMLNNYIKNNYKNVIVTDLEDFRVREIPKHFSKNKYVIISLVIADDDELKRRVLDESRDSGFRNVKAALSWNRKLLGRKTVKNELKMDNTHRKPQTTVKCIMKIIKTPKTPS